MNTFQAWLIKMQRDVSADFQINKWTRICSLQFKALDFISSLTGCWLVKDEASNQKVIGSTSVGRTQIFSSESPVSLKKISLLKDEAIPSRFPFVFSHASYVRRKKETRQEKYTSEYG